MRIEVKGRNLQVTDELREQVERRFDKVAKQVSGAGGARGRALRGAQSGQPCRQIAEATLYLKGVTLRAKDASRDLRRSINLVAEELCAPGQAPPRQAPQAARAAGRAAAARPDAGGARGASRDGDLSELGEGAAGPLAT